MDFNDLKNYLIAMSGGQTPGTIQASQQFAQRDPRQDRIGQVVPPVGAIANVLTGLGAVHPDQPHYIGGQQVLGGVAMPFRARGQTLEYLEKNNPTQLWNELTRNMGSKPSKQPETLESLAWTHGHPTTVRDGKLHVQETYIDPSGKVQKKWYDTTGWTNSDMYKWLGY